LLNHIGGVLSRYLKNATNNISMFYLRTSSLIHKIMQDNSEAQGSEAEAIWESSSFRISGSCNTRREMLKQQNIVDTAISFFSFLALY